MADLWMNVDATLAEVPVNVMPLLDATDFKSREEAVAYDDPTELIWHFTTTAGATSATVVTPTTGGGDYDWAHQDGGMYTIGIPASGGASINNDTEGFGWFTGLASGVLPWRGPVIGFRAAAVNDGLIDGGDLLDVQVAGMDGDVITPTVIQDDAITASKLAGDCITSTQLSDGTITAAKLGADCITSAKIADDAISAEHLNTGALTADAFAADALVAATFATGAFTADAFAADALVAATFATNSITNDAIAAGAITPTEATVNVTEIEGADPTDTINAACDAAIETYGLDHLISASVAGTDVADDSIVASLVSASGTADWDDFDNTSDSLQGIRDRGDSAWAGSPPTIMQSTTIATLSSQTSFTLTAGSEDDDAYNDAFGLVVDQSTSTQQCICDILDYTGATKTITLASDPGVFTMATGDTIYIIAAAPGTAAPTAAAVRAEIDSNSTQLAAIVADTNELQGDWTDGGRLDLIIDAVLADTNELQTDDIPGTLTTIEGKVDTIDGIVDNILVDTGTTLDGKIDTIDSNVDAILVDTGTTLPGTLTTIEGKIDTVDTNVDAVLVDTGTTLDGKLDTIDGNVDSILTDTGTTLPGALTTIEGKIDTVDTNVDAVLVDTGTTLPATEWQVDVVKISGDSTAADNLESYCDGTTPQPVNVTQISGDSTSADNLESYTDGTTPAPVNVTQISGDATAADNLESYCDGTDNQPVDVKEIDSDTTAASNLSASALGIVTGACEGTPSVTSIQTDLVEATDDHYIGRVIVFIDGDAAGQASAITDYTGATGTITLAAGTLTTAPAATDNFVIV